MALPIPFAYWHLMNLVFALNFLLLSIVMASFRTWLTIAPYGMALLIFMGLREVANALADPFGSDSVDFPLVQFLDYTFDHSVCLLEAFSHPDAYRWVKTAVQDSTPFGDGHLRRNIQAENLYKEKFRSYFDNPHMWNQDMPIRRQIRILEKKIDLSCHLKESLSKLAVAKPKLESGINEAYQRRNEELQFQLVALEQEIDHLRAIVAEAEKRNHPDAASSGEPALTTDTHVNVETGAANEMENGNTGGADPVRRPESGQRRRHWNDPSLHWGGIRPHGKARGGDERFMGRTFHARDIMMADFDEARLAIQDALSHAPNAGSTYSGSEGLSSQGSPAPSVYGGRR